MSNVAVIEAPSVLNTMAVHYGMDKAAFNATLRATVMPKDASNEQAAAFLLVAREHKLNPFTKEIFAFPAKGGGIQPVVSVDGWMKLINSNPNFDGMDFIDVLDEKKAIISVTCRIHRKDRSHPVEVTEYMSECRRDTDTWRKWPARMLRHKAAIQAARYAFGFAGIIEPDEAERADEAHAETITVRHDGPITPRTGVMDSLDEAEQNKVREVAAIVREHFEAGEEVEAYEYIMRQQLGAEERIAMEGLLTSKMRTALKTVHNTKKAIA